MVAVPDPLEGKQRHPNAPSCFIEDLGFTVEHNILYQNNQASIRLEINGPASSSKCTKYIKHKYFLIADNVARGDTEIRHKPTDTDI